MVVMRLARHHPQWTGGPERGQARTGRRSPTAAASRGGIQDALRGADVFIGLSGGTVPEEALAGMTPGGVIFGLANPTPEVHPDVAHRYAAVVATGRSDFPNQINNVLAFPGVFRGALDAGATRDHRGHEARRGDGDRRHGGRRLWSRRRSCRARWTRRSASRWRTLWPRPRGAKASCAVASPDARRLRRHRLRFRPALRPRGGRPARAGTPRQDWVTVDIRASSLNHHDLWSLRGVGLPADKLPMILGCDAAGIGPDGAEVVVHSIILDAPGAPPFTDPLRALPGHLRRARHGAGGEPAAQARRAELRRGGLPADRLAHRVPDAHHQGPAARGRRRAGAGRRRRGRHRRGGARRGARRARLRDQPRRRRSGSASPRSARPRWSPAPACRSGSTW